ncbi:hypothetical protein BsWGS_24658 [Bradybaena similaris]
MEHHRERFRCLQELGLRDPVSEDDIKKAYRAAAFKYHPDKNHGADTTDKFQQISAAYRFLTEGDSYLQEMKQESRFTDLMRFMFPWMFDPLFVFKAPEQNPYYNYYDSDSDDDDDGYIYLPRFEFPTYAASGASEHYRKNANFAQTSTQHGQFFQERNTKGKAAKKRNKDAKRATKLAADKERSDTTKTSTTNKEPQARADRAKSPTPDLSGKQQPRSSPPRAQHEKSQTPDSSNTSNNAEAKKDSTEEQTNKKSKKQIQMEHKQREKELKEINEELLKQEKERKEKMEKKRLAQEEKERQEREVREKEMQEREEEERKRAEELRQLLERKEEEKKRKKKEAARMKKLLEEFDSQTFLDDNGDFKYTDPEVKNIICRDDINHLGNANKNVHHEKFGTINGLDTECLIKLQEVSQAKEKKKNQEEQLGSPNHERLGPIGSRPQNQFNSQGHPPSQQNHHHLSQHRDYHHPGYQGRPPQHQHSPQHTQQYPQQQQQHRYQQQQRFFFAMPQPQPTHQMPFWSPTQPPPPLHSSNTNVPRPSGHFHSRFPNNKRFPGDRVYTRTHSSRGRV